MGIVSFILKQLMDKYSGHIGGSCDSIEIMTKKRDDEFDTIENLDTPEPEHYIVSKGCKVNLAGDVFEIGDIPFKGTVKGFSLDIDDK